VIKKLAVVVVSLAFALIVGFAMSVPSAHAAGKKVDCDKVMSELNSGKKPKEVAKDLGYSTSSVYKCRRQAKAAAKKAKEAPSAAASPGAAASPAKP
jgi:hypothetical protein